MLALLYLALEFEQRAVKPYVDQIKELTLGKVIKECLENNINTMPDNIDENLILTKLQSKLTIYGVLFLIVQLGILYLGSAFIARKFSERRLGDAKQLTR